MSDELMRDCFSSEIPEYDELEPRLRACLSDPSITLSDMYDLILRHIVEHDEGPLPLNEDDADTVLENAPSDTILAAYNAIDGLIENLEVNELNCRRLKSHVEIVESYEAYDRLLTDFREFLSSEEFSEIRAHAEVIFVPEVTGRWFE